MAAVSNLIIAVKWTSEAATELLSHAWPLVVKMTGPPRTMVIQDYVRQAVSERTLRKGGLPALPQQRPHELIFLYSGRPDHSVSFAREGPFLTMTISVPKRERPASALPRAWKELRSAGALVIFEGEELEVDGEQLQAIEQGRCLPTDMALCELGIAWNAFVPVDAVVSDEHVEQIEPEGVLFRRTGRSSM